MSFGDAFDAHDLHAAYVRLLQEQARRAGRFEGGHAANALNVSFPRSAWPDLPATEAAHTHRQWLDRLTVGDAEFLTGLGIDPVG